MNTHAAQQVVQACLLGWAGLEVLLWLRNRGGNTAPDLTFALVVASVAVGFNLRSGPPTKRAVRSAAV